MPILPQDMKFYSGMRAQHHQVQATNFIMEPNSYLDCSGVATDTTSSAEASGGGHASMGGSGVWNHKLF